MKQIYRSGQRGFTIVELLIVIVVIGILATVAIVSYNDIAKKGRDARRVSDFTSLVKQIEAYKIINGRLPEKGPVTSWATSVEAPGNYVVGLQGAVPDDPVNDANHHYRYYVYDAGEYGCDTSRGKYYVLQVLRFESRPLPDPSSPGFECTDRNWTTGAAYTAGGFER